MLARGCQFSSASLIPMIFWCKSTCYQFSWIPAGVLILGKWANTTLPL